MAQGIFPTLSASSQMAVRYRPSLLAAVASDVLLSASASVLCTLTGNSRGDPCYILNGCFGTDLFANGVCVRGTGGVWC